MVRVITYGSFDLFHEGHFKLLERAKSLGDYLIVGVTTEQFDQTRGKLGIVDSINERMENVRKTGFADKIIIEDHYGQKVEDIQRYNVDIITVGSDWAGHFDYLQDMCKVIYLERTKEVSSTELRAEKYGIVRLGIIGSGRIASRFVPESRYVSGINIDSVFNPNIESAKVFCEKFELNHATDDLDDFYEHIDAVYIASPHLTHYNYIISALSAGKHVLCEKPLSFTRNEAEQAFKTAKTNGLVLMEAIKTAFFPAFNLLLGVVKSGLIGAIRDVDACFTKLIPHSSKREWSGQAAGAFTELASYPLLAVSKLLGVNFTGVNFDSLIEPKKRVDYFSKAHFTYPNAFATVKVGIGAKSEGQLIITGTKGCIVVPAPWWKTESFEAHFENTTENQPFFNKYMGEGLRYEINEFIGVVNGRLSSKITEEESIFFANIIERFLNGRSHNGSK